LLLPLIMMGGADITRGHVRNAEQRRETIVVSKAGARVTPVRVGNTEDHPNTLEDHLHRPSTESHPAAKVVGNGVSVTRANAIIATLAITISEIFFGGGLITE